jgi:hypothetical protein
MISDKLLINLKILSKIQKNGKITRSYDGIISLDSETFYQPIRRFISSDSRKQAVFEINSIVNESIDTLGNIINSKFLNKHYYNSEEFSKHVDYLEMLINEFEQCKIGIENLKFTYKNDQNIVSQIDIILLKMNTTLKDSHQKLAIYKSYLPNQIQIPINADDIMIEPDYNNQDYTHESDLAMKDV